MQQFEKGILVPQAITHAGGGAANRLEQLRQAAKARSDAARAQLDSVTQSSGARADMANKRYGDINTQVGAATEAMGAANEANMPVSEISKVVAGQDAGLDSSDFNSIGSATGVIGDVLGVPFGLFEDAQTGIGDILGTNSAINRAGARAGLDVFNALEGDTLQKQEFNTGDPVVDWMRETNRSDNTELADRWNKMKGIYAAQQRNQGTAESAARVLADSELALGRAGSDAIAQEAAPVNFANTVAGMEGTDLESESKLLGNMLAEGTLDNDIAIKEAERRKKVAEAYVAELVVKLTNPDTGMTPKDRGQMWRNVFQSAWENNLEVDESLMEKGMNEMGMPGEYIVLPEVEASWSPWTYAAPAALIELTPANIDKAVEEGRMTLEEAEAISEERGWSADSIGASGN
jgi:hypothetical protein